MWSAILAIISSLVGWLTRKDERDVAEQTGEKVGHGDDAAKSLDAVQKAQEARSRVDTDLATHPDRLRDADPFERPN
jgi:hypothetical protein